MEEIKLSQEEIEVLTKLQDTQNNIISTLGQLEYNIQLLELQKESLTEQIEELKKIIPEFIWGGEKQTLEEEFWTPIFKDGFGSYLKQKYSIVQDAPVEKQLEEISEDA